MENNARQERCLRCMSPLNGAYQCPNCGFNMMEYIPKKHHLRPRTILHGQYIVGCVLGEGGFGITYVGWDLMLHMTVAIKEYFPKGVVARDNARSNNIGVYSSEDEAFFLHDRNKFLMEAQKLASFDGNPGVVSVKNFFKENGTAYIVMEFIQGINLESFARQSGGVLSLEQTLGLLEMPIMALAQIHRSGTLHRDISPENLMVTYTGKVKLIDFGSAMNHLEDDKSRTLKVRHGYSPSELYTTVGKEGPYSDVYSLCATIYKVITGTMPQNAAERAYDDKLLPPSKLGAAVSPQQERALMRGLALNPQERYQSVEELYADLRAAKPAKPKSSLGVRIALLSAALAVLLAAVITVVALLMRNAGPSVTFSSEELTALVREALGKESGGRIAPEDLEDIEELVLVDGEVSFVWPEGSLESAERYTGPEILVEDVLKFPNLISLFVLDAEIDEENLHMLPQLQYLTLWNCGLTDVSGLENQTGLKVLYLYRNQISDLSPLAGMVNLYRLGISNNPQVTDLSPLAGMQSLEDLRASYCGYHDISVLAELPRLSEFYGYNNYIYDWSPVANIAEVYGQDTQLDMPAPFRSAAFGELVRVALGKAEGESVMMSELQGIAKMTVDAVAGTISLGWPENGVPRGGGQLGMRIYASDLRLFGNLQSLYMNGADLHGERLTDMPNLTSLALVNCGLVSCDAVIGLENLSVLALYDNAISDVSTLTGMPLLALGMDGNPLSDLSPLAEFTELELLSIEDCRCTDLSPLSGLTKLVDLYVAGNSVTDWSPVSGVANIYGQDEG